MIKFNELLPSDQHSWGRGTLGASQVESWLIIYNVLDLDNGQNLGGKTYHQIHSDELITRDPDRFLFQPCCYAQEPHH